MIQVEFLEMPSVIKVAENSNFFARFEIKGEKVWLVWGNPNQKKHNETLIKRSQLYKICHCLAFYLDNSEN